MTKPRKGLRPCEAKAKSVKRFSGDGVLAAARDVLDCEVEDPHLATQPPRQNNLNTEALKPLAGAHIAVVLDDGSESDIFGELRSIGLRKFRDLMSPDAALAFMDTVKRHSDKKMILARLDQLGLLA